MPDKHFSVAALTPPPAGAPPGGAPGVVVRGRVFVPGDVFAGRYRMVTPLRRGPDGEVWRVDDLILDTPVALKLVDPRSDAVRERVLHEVRLARRITHPAICRVFDVGEADGLIYCSMELVEGETLATVIARAGRLPCETVVDIGIQLCAGLDAAHTLGVFHRGLGLDTVLIDTDGRVRLTDFGVSPVSAAQGAATTSEARSGAGEDASKAADLGAVGLLLYQMLVGARVLDTSPDGVKRLPKPSTVADDVDPAIERVVLQALSTGRRRFESAQALAVALADATRPPGVARRRRSRTWLAAAGLAAVVAIAGVLASRFVQRTAPALTDRDTIVLADFLNSTGDPVFDGTLKVALSVALEQSPFLKVFSDERVRESLRLMARAGDTPVSDALAREIARREGLQALVTGSIATLGTHYVLTLQASNAESGDVIAREQIEAPAKESVLASLGTAASRLRERLGESLASVQRFDAPLPRATTASLDALHAYSLALDEGRVVPRAEAIPHLKRALELDPNFVMARALLSGVYANTGRSGEAPEFSRKAFELRDRVSERERFFISWRYYVDAAQAWDKARDLAESWTKTYPREAFAFNSLGLSLATLGQHEPAVAALREAARLDPRFAPPYSNLAGTLIAMNRFDEAKAQLRDAVAHGIDFIAVRRVAYTLAFLDNDQAGMARELDLTRRTPNAMWASTWQARTSLFSGSIETAHRLFNDAVDAADAGGLPELAAQWTLEDAEAHALTGDCAEAKTDAAAGLKRSRDNFTVERAARTYALCGAVAEASDLGNELSRRFPEATLTTHLQVPVSMAALALRQGQADRALELLEPLRPYDLAPAAEFWPPYLRGLAYLQRREPARAAAEFETVLGHRGAAPTSPLFALSQLGRARAFASEGRRDARAAYESFFSTWKDAAAGRGLLKDAHAEYARLPE